MANPYLLPENVGPSDTAMVLEFLNAAQNAREIATAVELPNELDIGLRLGERLLRRREQLGGFTTLEQVYAVPLIGPERFTELVTSLSGARPPPAMDERLDRNLLQQITRRLNRLESQFDAGPAIRLRALNADALLGQDTVVLAQLTDAADQPLIDRELTAMSSWGLLSGRAGLRSVAGNSITVRSNHQGICRLRLAATTDRTLSDVDQASLSRALQALGTPGDTPRDSLKALGELTRLYRAPGNDSLRRAIDAYYQRYGEGGQLDAPIDSLTSWPRISITIVAWLTPEADAATAQIPTALINVTQRNWFYAWLWAYRQHLESESTLAASLADVNTGKRSGSGVLTDVFGRIGTFVAAQDGLVGQTIGRDFAANNLNQFLQTGLSKITPDQRARVLTGVTTGVTSLASSRAFAAHLNSRAGIKLEIDTQIAGIESTGRFDDLDGRITAVENSALTETDIGRARSEILIEARRQNAQQLDQVTRDLNARFDAVGQRIDRIGTSRPTGPTSPTRPTGLTGRARPTRTTRSTRTTRPTRTTRSTRTTRPTRPTRPRRR
jgi:hypothetical protein